MYKAEVRRHDLKIYFKEWKPVDVSNQADLPGDIDLMPVTRFLSAVCHERNLTI
jgi:hypothetical protein